MLSIFFEDYVLDTQYGFIPGRGPMDAWRKIFTKILKAKYIWEVDLQKFFDRVQITAISRTLRKQGIPEKIVKYLHRINQCSPKLRCDCEGGDLIDESLYRVRPPLMAYEDEFEKVVEDFQKNT